jgi:hypothetical protein
MKAGCYTCKEAAAILDEHPETVRRHCRRGILRAKKLPGGYRIYPESITDYLGYDPLKNKDN